jgi:hypothetical protein
VGVPQDAARGLRMLRQLCSEGVAVACNNLGVLLAAPK